MSKTARLRQLAEPIAARLLTVEIVEVLSPLGKKPDPQMTRFVQQAPELLLRLCDEVDGKRSASSSTAIQKELRATIKALRLQLRHAAIAIAEAEGRALAAEKKLAAERLKKAIFGTGGER